MKIVDADIKGLKIIYPDVFSDDRGVFLESYNNKKYRDLGIDVDFIQDNQSISKKNVIRGLHYQVGEYAQDKLVRVVYGKVIDYAIDVRFGSPTFGKYYSIELTGENFLQFFIPKGFAHGFVVLSDLAIFEYKCSAYYSKKDERGIIYNDPTLNIDWGIKNPIVSEKDLMLPTFEKIKKEFLYNEQD